MARGEGLTPKLRQALSNLTGSGDIRTEMNAFADDKSLTKEFQFWGRSTDADPVTAFVHLWTITNTWQFVDSTYGYSMDALRSFIMNKYPSFFS